MHGSFENLGKAFKILYDASYSLAIEVSLGGIPRQYFFFFLQKLLFYDYNSQHQNSPPFILKILTNWLEITPTFSPTLLISNLTFVVQDYTSNTLFLKILQATFFKINPKSFFLHLQILETFFYSL